VAQVIRTSVESGNYQEQALEETVTRL